MSARADETGLLGSPAGGLLERGLVPDRLIRLGIRRLLRARLRAEDQGSPEANRAREAELVATLKASPVAIHTADANQQHYELPSRFFELVLGRALKYSCAYYDLGPAATATAGGATLDAAESAMLELTCRRARLADGERILELGCGWGSLTLHMAERYPRADITAVSNSASQRQYILARARERGLGNVTVLTADANVLDFPAGRTFDRVVSVEMFEHMRNYEVLLGRIARWLAPAGTLFVHVFAHRSFAYPFEVRDASDWMARWFFTGGLMPSVGLLGWFQRDLALEEQWLVDGRHYARTARDWLAALDRNGAEVRAVLAATYGAREVTRWWVRWRVFFMACEELFGYGGGQEWLVSHYLFGQRPRQVAPGAVTAA
jgi:cyclopropane-fatty-acyl-phospholipid synthase